jgi:predicted nucleic acid-binding protein
VIIPSASDRIVVDSSGWIEYIGAGPKAEGFAVYLESQAILLLPSIVVYEVHKKVYREQGKGKADEFVSQAFGFGDRLIPLTLELAILASTMSLDAHLSLADAIIYTTAQKHNAHLVTSDAHFMNLPDVTVL